MIKRILVPVDFSDPSRRAIDYAIEFARPLGAELVLLHAVEPVYYPVAGHIYAVGVDFGPVDRAIERSARAQLVRLAAEVRARRVAVRHVLALGSPHQIVVDSAKKLKADLIIMSTHGRTGLSHLLMGSVAERVVRRAACPVLTVRARSAKATPSARSARAARPRRQRAARRQRAH